MNYLFINIDIKNISLENIFKESRNMNFRYFFPCESSNIFRICNRNYLWSDIVKKDFVENVEQMPMVWCLGVSIEVFLLFGWLQIENSAS